MPNKADGGKQVAPGDPVEQVEGQDKRHQVEGDPVEHVDDRGEAEGDVRPGGAGAMRQRRSHPADGPRSRSARARRRR